MDGMDVLAVKIARLDWLVEGCRLYDRYVVLNILGQGISGRVLECFDSETRERVAIKVPFERSSDLAEANIIALLCWPVCRSHSTG
jgi:hypothetical protein